MEPDAWPKSTREVAALLGIRPATLSTAVWSGRVPAPSKSPAGNYLWQPEDAQRASRVILKRSLELPAAHQG